MSDNFVIDHGAVVVSVYRTWAEYNNLIWILVGGNEMI